MYETKHIIVLYGFLLGSVVFFINTYKLLLNLFKAIYPFLTWCKLVRKPLHKMILGGILAAIAFLISGFVELKLLVNRFNISP